MYITSALLCAAVFMVYGTLSPYIAVLARSLGYSPEITGLLLGASELSAIIAPFIFGAWADRKTDYKTPLLTALALSSISAFAVFILKNPFLCALFIPVLALGYRSTVPLSDAAITVNIGRDGNYGKIRAMGSLSFVITVLLLQYTPVMRPNSASNIAFWAAVTSIILLGFILFIPYSFLHPLKKINATKIAAAGYNNKKEKSIWTPVFILGIIIIFLNRLSFAPIQSYISLYAVEYLKWDAVGLIAAVSAFSEMPLIFISGKIIKKIEPIKLLVLTCAANAVRLALIALFPFKGVLIASQLLHSLTFGVFHPAAVAFVTINVPPVKRAEGMSVYTSAGIGLATLLGNVAGGIIIGRFGFRALFGSFIFFALFAVLIYLIFAKRITRRIII